MTDVVSRTFALADILWFAAESGDPNPVHFDPEFAVRTYPGAVVAHGLHLVLWALDVLSRQGAPSWSELKAVFIKPVIVGDKVEATLTETGGLRLSVRGEAVVTIKFNGVRSPQRWTEAAPAAHPPVHPPVIKAPLPVLPSAPAALRLPAGEETLTGAFPDLGARLKPRALRGLSGIATVSGAVLGGMTTEFSVALCDDEPSPKLEYRLLSYHPALRRLELAFWGYGLIGKVAAIVSGDEGL